ncbi:MAG: flagellar motor switch protein FliN [Planctomycetota bacterium]|nr:MAG: flagellar motor switch protein FliN [Planctomycetota bacterium]
MRTSIDRPAATAPLPHCAPACLDAKAQVVRGARRILREGPQKVSSRAPPRRCSFFRRQVRSTRRGTGSSWRRATGGSGALACGAKRRDSCGVLSVPPDEEAQPAPEDEAPETSPQEETPADKAATEPDAAAAAPVEASSEDAAAPDAADAADSDDAPPATEAERLAQEALKAAQQAVADLASGDTSGDDSAAQPAAQPLSLNALEDGPAQGAPPPDGIDLLSDVNLDVRIELGRTTMFVEDVLKLSEGAVVELDKLAGDPVDVYVNDRHVARGEVLILNDNFCVRVSEIISASEADQE